jgi:hypothetical protein
MLPRRGDAPPLRPTAGIRLRRLGGSIPYGVAPERRSAFAMIQRLRDVWPRAVAAAAALVGAAIGVVNYSDPSKWGELIPYGIGLAVFVLMYVDERRALTGKQAEVDALKAKEAERSSDHERKITSLMATSKT